MTKKIQLTKQQTSELESMIKQLPITRDYRRCLLLLNSYRDTGYDVYSQGCLYFKELGRKNGTT